MKGHAKEEDQGIIRVKGWPRVAHMFPEVQARERVVRVCAEGVCPVGPADVAATGRGRARAVSSPLPN
jgi:hypothetical protein